MSAALLSALQFQARSTRDGQDIYPGTRISVNTSTDVLDEVLAASGYLLAEYARLNNVIAELHDGQTTFDAGAWDKEVSVMEDKLKLGARVALKRVDRALGAVGKHEGGDDKIPDDDMEGVDIEQHKEDLKFFKSLHYAQRGVRRMIKAVPGNEE